MPEEQKSRTTKRFGTRYGSKIRKKVAEIEKKSKKTYKCPKCNSESMNRKGTGIWKCNKCGTELAGGAYIPKTSTGETVERTLKEAKEEEEE
ncbi:MAG: Ribosomal protein L37AE/L43A [Candidatus Methanohalarchaeum thermophilum]|uniref:Large ribosomal subunit protein eL43 n=1 Tax=Methanohalarchaeum thermophilum TaxID=1903181 RepID=A0A1Q6DVU9_METT1|nr:MAG: Ribosomal protein L37AE/L43A [Candidatus Methanohalarchaeum thermophilum]